MFFVSCFIIMTFTDLKEQLVECNIAIAMAIAGFFWHGDVISSALGLIATVLLLELIARSGYLIIKSRAMGEADTYVAGALGAMFGIENTGWVLLYALTASMIFILPMFLYRQYKNNNKLTCIMSVLFILSVLIFLKLSQSYFALGFLVLSGAILAISILKSIKTEENRSYLPYVPALATGALYFIFFNIDF